MNHLNIFFILLFTQLTWAQTTSFRYEGKLQGPTITAGTMSNQTFSVTLKRPDGCGGNLNLGSWTSSTVTLEDGAFSISPTFAAADLAKAMDPWNDFSGACSVPYFARQMVINWNSSETFTIGLEDSPRASLASYAANAFNTSKIGNVAVQSNLSCGTNSVLKYASGTSQFECQTLAATDIPTSVAIAGDISGTLNSASVDKIRGISVSSSTPTGGQILKYDGTNWAPATDATGTTADASYGAKGLVQIDTDDTTSGLKITSGVLKLSTTGVTTGTYGDPTKTLQMTVDAQGRIRSLSQATVNDALKLPLDGSGTMTGSLDMGNQSINNAINVTATNFSGRNFILNDDDDSNTIKIKTPTNVPSNYTLTLPDATGSPGQVLSTDGTGILSWTSTGGGGVTNVTSANNYLTVTNPSTTPMLQLNVGTALNTVAAGNDSRIVNAVQNGGNTVGAPITIGTNDSNALNIETNNTSRMTILPAGQVGIGVTPHLADKLDIDGSLNFRGSASPPPYSASNEGKIYFDSTNEKFRVSEDSHTFVDLINTDVVSLSDYNVDVAAAISCSTVQTPYWNIIGDAWACQDIESSSTGGFIRDSGNDISSDVTVGTNYNYNLNFETNSTTKMTLDTSGKLGIGTQIPSSLLHVRQTQTSAALADGSYFNTTFSPSSTSSDLASGIKNVVTLNGPQNFTGTISGSTILFSSYSTSGVTNSRTLDLSYVKDGAGSTTNTQTGISNSIQAQNGTIANAIGMNTFIQPNTGSQITNATGLISRVRNNSTNTISTAKGLEISIEQPGSGSITTAIGIEIGPIAGTTKYAIKQTDSTAINHFAGNVGIGISTPGYPLDVQGDININASSVLRFGGSTQVCTITGCTSSSDIRLKKNIKPLENSLDKILSLQGVEYDWIDSQRFSDKHQVGLIAQDLEKVFPEVVVTDPQSTLKSVAYDHLIAPLIEAVKTLATKFDSLKNQVSELSGSSTEQARTLASIQSENAAKDKEIADLKTQVEESKKETAELKARLEKLEKKLGSD